MFERKRQSHNQFRYAVRRIKRNQKLQEAKGLFSAAMSGDIDLMKEMRRVTVGKDHCDEYTEELDGVLGENDVLDKFKEVYESLYNSSGCENGMRTLEEKVSALLKSQNSVAEIEKLTSSVVKEAVCHMKSSKMDVSGGFSSDCFLNAPDELFSLLATVYKCWLVHGKVP